MIRQLKKNGILNLFPVQQASFFIIAKGYDLTAKDRTGSGKTLAYSLPSLERLRKNDQFGGKNPKILIMLPTRELAIQVRSCFEKIVVPEWGVKTVAVYGGDDMRRQMDVVRRGCDVMVATPGRLIDFINRGLIVFKDLKCLVLDEADEMLKQGFQNDIEKIFEAMMKECDKKPQTLLFSATIPSWVKQISEKYQDPKCSTVDMVGNSQMSVPKTIKHYRYNIDSFHDIKGAVKRICRNFVSRDGRCLVFCETKKDVNKIYEELRGDRCEMLHGDVKQYQREKIYNDFKRGRTLIIVATNLAARGLDIPDIELVIQVEPPKHIESYIHRAGRTGRAGRSGKSVMLVQKRDSYRVRLIEDKGGIRFEELREKDLRRD